MSVSLIQNFLRINLGTTGMAGSTSGALNAKLGALLPYVVGTTGTVLTFPSTNAVVASAPDSVFGTSLFTTFISSGTFSNHMLTGLHVRFTSLGNVTAQIDFASGPPFGETVVFQTHAGCWNFTTGGSSSFVYSEPVVIFPPIQWPTNERASLRVSGSSTSIAVGVTAIFATRPA